MINVIIDEDTIIEGEILKVFPNGNIVFLSQCAIGICDENYIFLGERFDIIDYML